MEKKPMTKINKEELIVVMAEAAHKACVETYTGKFDRDWKVVHRNVAEAALDTLIEALPEVYIYQEGEGIYKDTNPAAKFYHQLKGLNK